MLKVKLTTLSEDIQQHVTEPDIKTLLEHLGDQNPYIYCSVLKSVVEFVKYGMLLRDVLCSLLKLTMLLDNIRQYVAVPNIKVVLKLLHNQNPGIYSSVLKSIAELVKYGML